MILALQEKQALLVMMGLLALLGNKGRQVRQVLLVILVLQATQALLALQVKGRPARLEQQGRLALPAKQALLVTQA